jgi:hypothetical protein
MFLRIGKYSYWSLANTKVQPRKAQKAKCLLLCAKNGWRRKASGFGQAALKSISNGEGDIESPDCALGRLAASITALRYAKVTMWQFAMRAFINVALTLERNIGAFCKKETKSGQPTLNDIHWWCGTLRQVFWP